METDRGKDRDHVVSAILPENVIDVWLIRAIPASRHRTAWLSVGDLWQHAACLFLNTVVGPCFCRFFTRSVPRTHRRLLPDTAQAAHCFSSCLVPAKNCVSLPVPCLGRLSLGPSHRIHPHPTSAPVAVPADPGPASLINCPMAHHS